jgi:dephospho-CoA kinase
MIHPENILYPAGHHAVGKTELCDYLVDEYGFKVVETGAMVRSLYASRSKQYEDLSLGEFVDAVDTVSPTFFDEELFTRITDLGGKQSRIIVNGMRAYPNIEYLKNTLPNTKHSVLWMQANFELLHNRYMNREKKETSLEEFKNLLDFDLQLGLGDIQDNADFTINNESTIDILRFNTDIVMRRLGLTALNAKQSTDFELT